MTKYTYSSQNFSKEDALVLLNAADNKETTAENKVLNKAFTIIFKNTKMLKEDVLPSFVALFQQNSSVSVSNKGRFIVEYNLSEETKNSIIGLAKSILTIKKEKQIAKINKELNLLK